jgi:O-glycosyl hydrolase
MAVIKNQLLKFGKFVIIITLFIFFASIQSSALSVTISTPEVVKRFEGWGTSICWWGTIIGKYSEMKRDSICTLLFDTSGLGLNIIRYNIGGGEPTSHNHMGAGREIEGYKVSENAEYDWSRDATQRQILQAAKSKINPNEFIAEAFSNSPPWWMTNSGCASGGKDGASNLKSNYYKRFAEYLTDVVKHFSQEWGITFRTIEPFNEPISDWWKENGGQEGCHFSRNEQMTLIKLVSDYLKINVLPSTEISASDETGYNETFDTYNTFDSATKALISQINTHGYSGTKRKEIHDVVVRDNKRLWQSELDGSGAASPFDVWAHNHNDIVPGLDIAQRIIRDLKELQPDAIITWQVVESEQAQINLNKNWGCIHADFNGGEKFYITKKYYSVKQFTKFIRIGSILLNSSNPDAVAFVDMYRNKLIIVQRNATNAAVSYDYNLKEFKVVGEKASVWRTSVTENFANLESIPISNNVVKTTSKEQSITTYIIDIENGPVKIQKRVEKKESQNGCTVRLSSKPDMLIIQNNNPGISELTYYSVDGRVLYRNEIKTGMSYIPAPVGLNVVCITNNKRKTQTFSVVSYGKLD